MILSVWQGSSACHGVLPVCSDLSYGQYRSTSGRYQINFQQGAARLIIILWYGLIKVVGKFFKFRGLGIGVGAQYDQYGIIGSR